MTPDSPIESFELPARGLTSVDVLRIFDILRRRFSIGLSGTEGAFAGYDDLELSPIPGCPEGRLRLTVQLVDTHPRCHRVAYEAALVAHDCALGCSRSTSVIARGVGSTVASW